MSEYQNESFSDVDATFFKEIVYDQSIPIDSELV